MAVGLGSGSTVNRLVEVLAESPPAATFVAASLATAEAAAAAGLRVVPLDELRELDLALDGADQVDPERWLIKGGGAAHTREKIVAAATRRFVVIVSSDKLVEAIAPPIPLELLRFGVPATLRTLGPAEIRGVPLSPDGGVIADYLGPVEDPGELAVRLSAIPGVVEHGLFPPELVTEVLVGRDGGIDRITP